MTNETTSRRSQQSMELSTNTSFGSSKSTADNIIHNSVSRRSNNGPTSALPLPKETSSKKSSVASLSSSSNSKSDSNSSEVFLLDRMGGDKALDAVVEEFYNRLIVDEDLQLFFHGVSVPKVKRHQKAFLKLAFTKIPDSIDVPLYLLQKHERLFQELGLNELHFDKVAFHLVETLKSMGVPNKISDEVVAIVGPLRAVFQTGAELVEAKKVPQLMTTTEFPLPTTDTGILEALLHSIQTAGAALVRLTTATLGIPQIKTIPLAGIQPNILVHLNERMFMPDFATLRILPHSKTAILYGYHVETLNKITSLHAECPRGLLARVIMTARSQRQLVINIGATMTFRCLGKIMDMEEQEHILATVLDQLKQLNIQVFHAECGDSTMKITFREQNNAVRFLDTIGIVQVIITQVAKGAGKKVSFAGYQGRHSLLLQLSYRQEKKGTGMDHSNSTSSLSSTGDNGQQRQQQSNEGNYFAVDGQSFVEGILEHLPSLLAVTSGVFTNHLKVGWNFGKKDAPLGVGRVNGSPAFVDYRVADATMNLYLGVALILACGVMGVTEAKKLRSPLSVNMDSLEMPDSLENALTLFDKDRFLHQVMGPDLSMAFLVARREETTLDGISDGFMFGN